MTQYFFGSGTVIGKRTDVAYTAPAFLGTLQDFEIDIDQSIKTLMGQLRVPVAAGAAELKISGKAKFARFQSTTVNNLLLGQTLTPNSFLDIEQGEPQTVPSGAGYTITTNNAAYYTEDWGVFYASNGQELTPVASAPAAGEYSVNVGTGVYTFSSADADAAVLIYYGFTSTVGNKITITNTQMGPLPSFSMIAKQTFTYFGAQKSLVLKLNACVSSKLTMPFKNTDFAIQEMDIQALADAAGNVGTLSMTE